VQHNYGLESQHQIPNSSQFIPPVTQFNNDHKQLPNNVHFHDCLIAKGQNKKSQLIEQPTPPLKLGMPHATI
jgi:hypothetical protein